MTWFYISKLTYYLRPKFMLQIFIFLSREVPLSKT